MASIPRSAGPAKGSSAKHRRKVLVLHGIGLMPGSNALAGVDRDALAIIDARLAVEATSAAIDLIAFQSDQVAALIDRVRGAASDGVRFIVIDPAGLTHSSPPLRDALSAAAIPFIEVHLSNVDIREPFRRQPAPTDKAVGTIVGLGTEGYRLAVTYALRHAKG